MKDWNFDMGVAPIDGRMVLVLEHHGFSEEYSAAAVHWQVDSDGAVFGWTYDGGDRFNPIAWAPITDPEGDPIYP